MSKNKEITVLIADDHPVFLSGLQMVINAQSRMSVISLAANGKEAICQIRLLQPDVAVLDVSMPDKNGFDVVRELGPQKNKTKFIFLTMHDEEATLHSALDLGVKGYILKDSGIMEIVDAIKNVSAGHLYVTPKLTGFLVKRNQRKGLDALPQDKFELLTQTEIRVLKLISQQKTTKEIAEELFVSRRTVDNHRYHICQKLEIKGINSLLKFAIEHKEELNFL